jgi:hypothetical protein
MLKESIHVLPLNVEFKNNEYNINIPFPTNWLSINLDNLLIYLDGLLLSFKKNQYKIQSNHLIIRSGFNPNKSQIDLVYIT